MADTSADIVKISGQITKIDYTRMAETKVSQHFPKTPKMDHFLLAIVLKSGNLYLCKNDAIFIFFSHEGSRHNKQADPTFS